MLQTLEGFSCMCGWLAWYQSRWILKYTSSCTCALSVPASHPLEARFGPVVNGFEQAKCSEFLPVHVRLVCLSTSSPTHYHR